MQQTNFTANVETGTETHVGVGITKVTDDDFDVQAMAPAAGDLVQVTWGVELNTLTAGGSNVKLQIRNAGANTVILSEIDTGDADTVWLTGGIIIPMTGSTFGKALGTIGYQFADGADVLPKRFNDWNAITPGVLSLWVTDDDGDTDAVVRWFTVTRIRRGIP